MVENIFQVLIHLISEHANIDPRIVTRESSLENDLGFDSLDSVQLIMACEDEFEISMSDEHLDNYETVKDVLDIIIETKNKQNEVQ